MIQNDDRLSRLFARKMGMIKAKFLRRGNIGDDSTRGGTMRVEICGLTRWEREKLVEK